MKVHYINILLFELLLKILLYNQRNHKSTTHHTPKIPTTRSLCECELYTPNYDNDPEMKRVMQQFHDRTTQRFQEYDESLHEKRQVCKDNCDKEIQKIILKDKIEKELTEKFSSLHTDIQSDDIPTCICEKSVADKMEKGCLRCAGVLGGGVMPGMGLIDGSLLGAISVLKPLALDAAKAAAAKAASDAATQAGIEAVKFEIRKLLDIFRSDRSFVDLTKIVDGSNFKCPTALFQNAEKLLDKSCTLDPVNKTTSSFCNTVRNNGIKEFNSYTDAGSAAFEKTLASQTTTLTEAKVGAVEATYASYQTAIIASIVAIVVIVLIMVIIYKILRYRRKKKMKKKLQYIKLLKE
ncbi:hypothetical protein PFNF135_02821 [Plasmodium falciparum NF135/5.C10]|uniref:Surface antigen n=1 Tax=Plasmodium falciparum NF135/5.C10 TaxID=1036726 RepID=W4IHK9_PLAFA|nr:hypothetical protein PFNF135_02821 [Plasmodium falciparum NF135/5.C10]